MQSLLRLAFPPTCVSCHERVERDFGLCGTCWRETPFVMGTKCDTCGVPLPGPDQGHLTQCDDCMVIARPWRRGRAALVYKGNARKLVLALKHGDRLDLARPMSDWMAGAGAELLFEDTVLVPVPAHPLRLVQRRYNQAAVLANALRKPLDREVIPDLLRRTRQTKLQDGMGREARFQNLSGAIKPARHAALRLKGRPVLLIDDVMTSGATLAAAADAAQAIGARQVDILTLARVAKDV